MKKQFFMVIMSFFLFTGLNMFQGGNSLMAQSQTEPNQMGQPRSTSLLLQELQDTYSLPAGPVTRNDIPRIKTVIEEVLDKITESLKSTAQSENESDAHRPFISGILVFQDWLTGQGCVRQASNWYVEDEDKYHDHIFLSYPGQVPFDILFNMEGLKPKDSLYRLLIFVSDADLLKYASFSENKTIIEWPDQKTLFLVPPEQ